MASLPTRPWRIGALAGAATLLAVPVGAAPGDAPDALRTAERSVVRVVTVSLDATGQPVALDTGSGFAVAPGKVVTNDHVVQGAAQAAEIDTFVIPERDVGGAAQKATVTQTWSDADLALLTAPGLASPTIPIARVAPGKDATVRALGYPGVTDAVRDLPLAQILSPQETYDTSGSIALFSSIAPGGSKIDTIFHTAAINPGNSGGPLIDECGRVIGVNTWGAGAQLGSDGQVTAPQGQFVATRSSELVQFLGDAQVAATLIDGPCVPAAAQILDDRLKADETAISSQNASLAKLQAQLAANDSSLRQQSIWLGGLTGALVVTILALIARALFGRPSRKAAPAPPPIEAAQAPAGELAPVEPASTEVAASA